MNVDALPRTSKNAFYSMELIVNRDGESPSRSETRSASFDEILIQNIGRSGDFIRSPKSQVSSINFKSFLLPYVPVRVHSRIGYLLRNNCTVCVRTVGTQLSD
jgi:hypothetical protein